MLRAQGTAVNSLGELTCGSGIDMEEISTARSGTVQSAPCSSRDTQEELSFLNDCKDAGVVYILGNNVIKARKDSGFWKKFAIDYVYTFLRRSCRESRVVLNIPHECLLQVGMIYYV
jgi:KUP system potassium uptake protein